MEGPDHTLPRGLKGIFNKHLRNREEPDIAEEPMADPRSSSDTMLGRWKNKLSIDETRETGDEKLTKFLPGHSRRKQRKKAQRTTDEEDDDNDNDDDDAGSTQRKASIDNEDGDNDDNQSDTTAGDEVSLMTSDSESRNASVSRPALVDHKSHLGYLTSSSPQIHATTVDSAASETGTRSPHTKPNLTVPQPPKKSASGSKAATNNNLATQHDITASQLAGASTLSIDSQGSGKSSKSRSVSPGSKIKDAFKPSRRGTTPNSPVNGERPLSSPGLGGFFNREKVQKNPEGTVSQDSLHRKNQSATQSVKSIPSIVTTSEVPPPLPSAKLGGYEMAVTPPTPVESSPRSPVIPKEDAQVQKPQSPVNSNITVSPSGNMISHRRARSDTGASQPSKLSQSMAPPLTPTVEEPRSEVKTPGVRTASQSGGFFTTMFSAAQNAATTITNIGNNSPGRPRSTTGLSAASNEQKSRPVSPAAADGAGDTQTEPAKSLAIDTIGSGELNFSHLGISSELPSAMSGSPLSSQEGPNRSRSGTVVRREEASAREEDISAARAVSVAYSSIPDDVVTVEDGLPSPAPAIPKAGSVNEGNINSERTPPTSVYEGAEPGLFRSGSLRNKVERAKKRRHHNNSSTASTAIGAAVHATNSAAMGGGNSSNPKMTGFAVATKKRNRDFHQLFRSVPEDDYLIEDYNCALQRDILLAGRIYISEGHICFSSNILGWVTTLVISFDEIVCIEKESTAMVFPNAIAIQTLHARHTFRSLINRDTTYDLMIKIWKISHPGLQSSENGVNVTTGTGSKTEKIDHSDSEAGSAGSENSDVYDEDDESGSDEEDQDDERSEAGTGGGSVRESLVPDSPPKLHRKPSNIAVAAGQAGQPATIESGKAAEKAAGAATVASDFPGPATHAPTECSDSATHYEKTLKDETIPAPLGKVFSMVFGTASGGFMSRWLVDDQKVTDLQMDESKSLGEDSKTRSYTYIKPLGGSIGPKQTKCIISEQLDSYDLEKAVSVTITTQTPDVPSGNVFSTKTRYCLMWGPNNSTRMIMGFTIEWTSKSWLKGPIEKGASDGQIQFANDLFKALRNGVSSKSKAAPGGKSKKGKRKKGSDEPKTSEPTPKKAEKASWGPLEPLRSILEPTISILGPVVNIYTMGITIVVLAVLYSRSTRSAAGLGQAGFVPGSLSSSQRQAAYEQLWRSEENALWEWLEDRVGGPEGIVVPGTGSSEQIRSNADQSKTARQARQQVFRGEGGGLSEREVKRAIEVTEKRLKVLKDAVGGVDMGSTARDQL